ncbi:serine/threonine-protein kinase 11-interacting protein isoform X1 [Scophthalmus maximus]|uniref:serine/threonine-protein kinase 11-interacting protein isoform X1 n=1 Tax=Scophthalmus maximus TaxID=52904 RepID=UPI001FA8F47B|nr:serine/threonine-protein kinase 11-interacting protein isoform X1 [Scophthalmus maximus]XP_035490431.2 serine/threonine-protein kinase 11-interacting protein isoform X1 [Scophthalmus maximus]
MAVSPSGQSSLVHSLATLLRNDGDLVLDGSSTLTLPACSLQQLTRLFEQYLLSRSQQHGFLALPSHPADTASLLQLQFLFDVLQKTISLKLINPPEVRLQSVVKIFPFKSLKCLELKRIPPHCLEGLRGVYSQLEVFTCSKSLSSLEELLSLCGGDLSSALPWLELHTLNFSFNSIVCLDQSLSLLNVLKSMDLSHNKIQECAEFLKPLSELERLNLGYNCLQRAPTLGPSARVKLLTLILRNNELETINGVEQLSSLQHLDLAYNLLLEHSQLAPLSMLHCLHTLNLEGNPLFFQKTHRTCTVPHLSPKAANLRLKLDGIPLSSYELSVLPKQGQLVVQVHTLPPPAMLPERCNQEVSSGAGELTDSMSVEVGVSHIRRKKSRNKVKVRRASISEPSDTDYEPRHLSSAQSIVLPHQQEIERMSSFREQLGEDWLRYQHHLDGASPSVITSTISQTQPILHQTLTNGFSTITPRPSTSPAKQPSPPSMEVPEVLPPPLLSSEPRTETSYMDADQETDSTLQWPEKSTLYTESTLEDSAVDGQEVNQAVASSEPSPDSQRSARAESRDTKEEEEEEEEDLGVDLCHPLLVGVLSDKEEEDDAGKGKKRRREVFLCIKQGLVLEVDMQRGKEKCRLELDSLARVETTKAAWTHLDTDEMLPAVELHFDYINREKRRRRYVLLDDDPQQALQALTDVLCHVAEENQRRYSELCPGRVHLQCLRCRLDFTLQGEGSEEEVGGGARRRGAVMIPEGREERDREGPTDAEFYDDSKGKSHICPECGSDHVVQLADQSDHYSSTPIDRPPRAKSEDDHLDITQSARGVKKDDDTNASLSSSPILETSTATEDPTFATAQGSSFLNGDENDSLSYNTECQSKEDLAGSYHYTSIGATTPEVQAQPSGRSTPNDDVDLLSEDYESVDHRLKLFLDVEVFEEEEELHSFLKMSAVRFGELGEVPSLLVVSNQRIYILEMKQEMHRGQLSDWLQKRDSHPIMELSYLEVGLGSQSIHMEFGDGVVAYTLLVRDSLRCKRFFGLLTGIVREMAHKSDSKLKSISTTRLNPQHHLWPLVCDDIQADVEDGQLQFFYILAFVLQEDVWMPLTVLATRETLYLLREDHQWTKSSSVQTAVEDNEPSSGNVTVLETLPISCVSSVHLWPSDERRMDLKLYDETVKQEKTWRVRLESAELLQGLLAWVRAQWEAMFGVKLHTGLQDEAAQWGMA